VRAAGFTRTILNKQDFPGSDYITRQVQVDVDPGFLVARHTHPDSPLARSRTL
jgi:hypothetical protein